MHSKPALIIPSIGRTVHFVLPSGEHRPAVIVRVFDPSPSENSRVNLQVFTDATNDGLDSIVWRTSVAQDAEQMKPSTWHFPEPIARMV
jgi:hypothetical protein